MTNKQTTATGLLVEEAMQRLEEIVQGLEQGNLSLGDSLKVFEEGMDLAKLCTRELESAEKKVSLLVKDSGGKYSEIPFEPDGTKDAQ